MATSPAPLDTVDLLPEEARAELERLIREGRNGVFSVMLNRGSVDAWRVEYQERRQSARSRDG